MNRRQILYTGAMAIGSLGLTGCPNSPPATKTQKEDILPQLLPNSFPRFGSKGWDPTTKGELLETAFHSELLSNDTDVIKNIEKSLSFTKEMDLEALKSTIAGSEMANNFFAFQIVKPGSESTIKEATAIEPEIETSDANPDVVLDVSLEAFHLGYPDSQLKDNDTATLRLTLCNDPISSREGKMETLFWTITSALRLYKEVKGQKILVPSQDLHVDYRKTLGNQRIKIPGAVGSLKIEMIKHKAPAWWKRILSFLKVSSGEAVTAAIGLPGVTREVVNFVDDATSRFDGGSEVLLSSRPLKFAFSKQAKDYYTNRGVEICGLNSGFWVIARGKDLYELVDKQAHFHATYNTLIPGRRGNNSASDPFRDITYAILNVEMKPTRLNVDI